MTFAAEYFNIARNEESSGNECAALLFYLSSFCDSFNTGVKKYPYGTIAKIQNLQTALALSDQHLMELVYSYGPLSNDECQKLLYYSIHGCPAGIEAILSSRTYGYQYGGN